MLKIKSQFTTNIYIATTLRLLLVMAIFQLSRLGFYIFNIDNFESTTLLSYTKIALGGINFDLTAILYTNALFIVLELLPLRLRYKATYRAIVKYIFILFNAIIILVNTADYVYYRFTFRRTTGLIFSEFKNESNLFGIMEQSMVDYWYITIWALLLIALLVVGYNSIKVKAAQPRNLIWYYSRSFILLLAGITLFIGGVRGGYAHSTRPITISNATDYITNIGEEVIVLNTPFSIFRTLDEQQLTEYKYFDDAELNQIYSPHHNTNSGGVVDSLQRKNVVIIIMESFGREYIGALNRDEGIENYKGYTPFLDSLIGHSLYFTHAFANGKKSIEAMSSILTSIPSFTEPFILSTYSQNRYNSISYLLGEQGYESIFYHGAPNGSMGFSAFAKKIGIRDYVGKSEYDNDADFDGMWGIWDEPFMQFMAHDLDSRPQPFIATLFSLSSHHPFRVPEQYDGTFDKGDIPIHQTVGYSDNALRNFFDSAKKMDWYDNTLFVITADHTNLEFYDHYKTPQGRFYVPIILYTPSEDIKGKRTESVQQIDIMPTVLDYLGYDKPFFSFGKSILEGSDESDFAITYNNSMYNIFVGDHLMLFDGERAVALYDYKSDWGCKTNIVNEDTTLSESIERRAKGFIQSYNSALIHDKMN